MNEWRAVMACGQKPSDPGRLKEEEEEEEEEFSRRQFTSHSRRGHTKDVSQEVEKMSYTG